MQVNRAQQACSLKLPVRAQRFVINVRMFVYNQFERALRPCKLLDAERQEIGFGNLIINLCSCCLFSSQIAACIRICAIKHF